MESPRGVDLLNVVFPLKRAMMRIEPPQELTRGAFFMLGGIYRQCGGDQTVRIGVSALSSHSHLSSSATSQVLGQLEKKELIERFTDETDRRSVSVSLTEKGVAFMKEREHELIAMLDRVMSNFSKEEEQELIALLQKLSAAIDHELTKSNKEKR